MHQHFREKETLFKVNATSESFFQDISEFNSLIRWIFNIKENRVGYDTILFIFLI